MVAQIERGTYAEDVLNSLLSIIFRPMRDEVTGE
jgi:hypothetical protein